MPYNRQLYYYLSFIIIYKLNKGVMFIDTTVYYSLYIIIYKLTKGVPVIHTAVLFSTTLVYSNSFLTLPSYPLLFPFPHLYIYYSSLNNLIYA